MVIRKQIIRVLLLTFLACVIFIFPIAANAATGRSGNNVIIKRNQIINDDLYISGATVQVNGTVYGDVVAAGSTVIINGDIHGDVIATGGQVSIGGKISRTARIAGGSVSVDGSIRKDLVLAGGNVTVSDNTVIGRDLVVGAGSASVLGNVGRFLAGGTNQLDLNGKVGRSVTLQVDKLKVGSNARIGGNLKYKSQNKADISSNARIQGKITRIPVKKRPAPKFAYKAGMFLLSFIWLLVLGTVLLAIVPKFAADVDNTLQSKPWQSLGIGAVSLIVVPVAVLFLLITIIGIPIAMISLFLYLISIYIAKIYVGYFIGERVFSRLFNISANWFWSLTVGLLIILSLAWIPYIGFLVRLAVILFGIGAFTITLYSLRKESRGA